MNSIRNPGRVAGLLYLLLIIIGPLRLKYIPDHLFVTDNASATANNIAAHQTLFGFGIVADLAGAVILVLMGFAFYRLFETVDRHLAALVVVFGGVMPSLLFLVNIATDIAALAIVRGANFLSAFNPPQRDAIVMLLLEQHDHLNTAAEVIWGVWLFPLAILIYRSRLLPRFLGVWLGLNGVAWIALSMTGVMAPQYQHTVYRATQPAMFAEIALMLWLVIKGGLPTGGLHIRPETRANGYDGYP